MRGSPLLRAFLVVAALLLLLIPLLRLTKASTATAATVAPSKEEATKKAIAVHIELTSTRVPLQFEVLHLGKVVWSGVATQNQVQKELEIEFPKEGVDFELKGNWKEGDALNAVKLTVTPGAS